MFDKEWYKSKTIWGVIIGFVALILRNYGIVLTSEAGTELVNSITQTITAVVGLIGLIMAIWGRRQVGKEVKRLRVLNAKLMEGPEKKN